ncbi:transmembrane and ubiquitin-like domain-containing protein 1 [Xenopus tropicalis]|uniref:Transmembrane and ubiquitin-like domain-containing protein 1 n=1 Tax=Xenopus tropicalis TaxID=8364 RepID=A0A8J1JNP2_XENTR|nr:transmembrane and ubiquitin-like domain-containing protein 1 [Xenopus tropicalis]
MALIEGVGDEVTVLFALVLFLLVLALAWVSTHTTPPTHWVPPESAQVGESASNQQSDLYPRTSQTLTNADPIVSNRDPQDAAPTPHSEGASAGSESNVSNEESSEGSGPCPAADLPPGTESPPNCTESNRGPQASAAPSVRYRGPSDSTPAQSAGEAGSVRLRLKFLNDTERLVTVRLSDTIMYIKRTHFPGQELHVRLIFQGRLLRDDSQTVSALQLRDGSVLHCHISQHASVPGAGGEHTHVPLNVGSLLVPLLLLILLLLWYCQFQYPALFTGTATACLGGFTLLVSAVAFSSYHR